VKEEIFWVGMGSEQGQNENVYTEEKLEKIDRISAVLVFSIQF
jgi:hypothetical protein